MNETAVHPAKNFLLLMALVVATTVLLVLAGFVPTQRLGGSVQAMLAGCAISLFGSLMGSLPVLISKQPTSQSLMQGQLMAMLIRMMVVCVAALSITLSGWFDRTSLLIWVALSYVTLLVPETIWIVRQFRAISTTDTRLTKVTK